jgi:hypothetical protein
MGVWGPFLDECHARQAKKIATLNPQVGHWGQLGSWFGDVWGEIIAVFPPSGSSQGAMVLAQRPAHPGGEYACFYELRDVKAELPESARIIHHADGRVERRGWAACMEIEIDGKTF